MPELVEVEILRRDLEKEVVGRRIKDAEVRAGTNAMKVVPKHGRRKEFTELLEGVKVEAAGRIGMRLLLDLDNDHTIVIDLGPAGQLLKSSASDEVAPHTHVLMPFTIGGQLRFIDPLKEGEVWVCPNVELKEERESPKHRIDPLEHAVAWQEFSQVLAEQERPLKELLMDETFIVGLGDIYSDEILWVAGLRCDKISNQLTSQDVRRLYRALMEVLQDALKARGVSFGEYPFTDLQGVPGEYQKELKAYGQDGSFCRRCRNTVEKIKFGKGISYLCPQCQT